MPRDYPSSRAREYSASISRSRSISSQRSHHQSRGKQRHNSPYQRSYRNDSYIDKDEGVRVHVSDLSADCSKRELEEAFGKFGTFKEVWVARNPPCFAFIVFNYRQDAEEAIRKMDNTYISGGRIRVSFARPRTRGTRRGTVFDPNMRCYTCGERGHFSRECPKMNRGYMSPSNRRSNRGRKRDRSASRSRSKSAASSQTYSDRSSVERQRPSRNRRHDDRDGKRPRSSNHREGSRKGDNNDKDRNGRRNRRASKSSSEENKGIKARTSKSPLPKGSPQINTEQPRVDVAINNGDGEIASSVGYEQDRSRSQSPTDKIASEALYDQPTEEEGGYELSNDNAMGVDGDVKDEHYIEDLNDGGLVSSETVITESVSVITYDIHSEENNEDITRTANDPNTNNNPYHLEIEESITTREEIGISIEQDEGESLDD